MPRSRLVMLAAGVTFALAAIAPLTGQQLPLAPAPRAGAIVTPVFEGWYPNKDGTFSISFGYFNRNSEEAIDVPIGPDNFDRARRAESRTADALRAETSLGRVRGEGAGRLRQEGSGVDAQDPRPDVRDSRQSASELADRRARRRSGIGQHAAGAQVERNGTGRRGAWRHHGRTDHGERRQARDDHRVGEGRRQSVRQRGECRTRRRAGDAHVVQASGPGHRDVHAADRARAGRPADRPRRRRRSASRATTSSASARTTRRASRARATRSAAGRTDS